MHQDHEFPVDQLDESVNRCANIWSSLRGARVFVTGGTGLLGRWIVATLLRGNETHALDLRVVCLTRSPERFTEACPTLCQNASLTLVAGDIRSFELPSGKFTHLIHAAADTSAEADSDPLLLFDSIVSGTQRVLDFARVSGIHDAVFTSSGAVYGQQPIDMERIPETYLGAGPTNDPRSTYGTAKRAAEQLFTIYHNSYGISTKIARCFAFAGPHMSFDGHFAIGNFIRDAVRGDKIVVKGDGTPLRSFLYPADTAAWLLTILVNGQAGGIYNVGSDEAVTIAELAERVSRLVPSAQSFEILGKPDPSAHRSRYIPDISKAREKLRLDVWTDLDETIRRTAGWYAGRPTLARSSFSGERNL